MLENITYFQILGRPLIMYIGLATLLSLFFTAYIAVMNKKGVKRINFKWHPKMAGISLTLATIHALLGILTYF